MAKVIAIKDHSKKDQSQTPLQTAIVQQVYAIKGVMHIQVEDAKGTTRTYACTSMGNICSQQYCKGTVIKFRQSPDRPTVRPSFDRAHASKVISPFPFIENISIVPQMGVTQLPPRCLAHTG